MYSGLYAAEQTILQLHSGYSKWIEPVTNKRVLKGDKNLISHPKYFRNPKFPNFAKLCFVVVFSEAFFWLVPVRQVTSTVWSIPIFSVLKKGRESHFQFLLLQDPQPILSSPFPLPGRKEPSLHFYLSFFNYPQIGWFSYSWLGS